ncbi:zeta toxin family protein [Mucilaginibacter daejeonensis]|uniref:glycoside hydrolase 100 family protein n=1 Tax=Mucilaginibacter daejeonensis TaxID=398049 RepID=UPI001D179A76|nr:glycoside hydrolase 100 family protein [Mucilaginibacter daejeonensis]UEG54185.1 zeta toxin family protein [Mucilaginibacter daejeonensis]
MDQQHISNEAVKVIQGAVRHGVLLASAQATDNYTHVWARDSVVTGLAILSNGLNDLHQPFLTSLKVLRSAASDQGQIPSNVAVNEQGEVTKVSFGGTAGRTDANFWWLIGAVSYLQYHNDNLFAEEVRTQAGKIFALATAWEFNGKHLMYVPMSGNWADEYITHGYVLYDQLLRYWALGLAGSYFNELAWTDKAAAVKQAIKQHYLFEQPLSGSLYTQAQQSQLQTYDLEKNFIASFSPGDRVEKFDGWSIGLLLLLNIPSPESRELLAKALQNAMQQYQDKGIPAFWPEIKANEEAYKQLLNNHSFNFKNKPGHFHNGGIWPIVNGFIVAGLTVAGENALAQQINASMLNNLQRFESAHPFAEYYDIDKGDAGGVANLCFSASGHLLAKAALAIQEHLLPLLPQPVIKHIVTHHRFDQCAKAIADPLHITANEVMAISVAGQSGCGKTTLSSALQKTFEDRGIKTILLHQDDYFKLPPRQNHMARVVDLNHVGYHEVDTQRLESDIRLLKDQRPAYIEVPHMNWLSDERESRTLPSKDVQVIIVEGTYTSMLNGIDLRIFINTDHTQTRQNRLDRSRETIDAFIESVLEKERGLIRAHEPLADVIVNSDLEIFTSGSPAGVA